MVVCYLNLTMAWIVCAFPILGFLRRAYWFLGDQFGTQDALGGCLIVVGLILVCRSQLAIAEHERLQLAIETPLLPKQ